MGRGSDVPSEGVASAWIAREAIRDLVARYNQQGDRGNLDSLLELFAPHATLQVGADHVYRGREEIRTLFAGAVAESSGETPIRVLRHFTATHQIDVEGEHTARGCCYFAVLTEMGLDHWGRYLDAYVRGDDGRWRFAARKVVVEGRVPDGWGARAAARLHGGV